MKSIIHLIFSFYRFSCIYVILACIWATTRASPPPCGLYGAKPCQFVPAPPGQTPACARPGKTYCEHADNYPTYLIKHLVHKWGYEAKNLLVDETWDDFAALAWPETPVFFDPTYIFPHRHFHGYNYETPLNGGGGGGGGGGGAGGGGGGGGKYGENTFIVTKQQPTETPTFLLYSSAGQRLGNKNQVSPFAGNLKVTPNNPTLWLKRIVRDLRDKRMVRETTATAAGGEQTTDDLHFQQRNATSHGASQSTSRDVSLNMDLLDIVGVGGGEKGAARTRVRRQSPGRSTLCQTSSQFITPQAALNGKGNWMFVVNEANTARQMVKAELCTSSTCSNLCQLPNGYNSRCEQKYVQKRLIALQASGQNLYTDSFWFPSCCVCTISTN